MYLWQAAVKRFRRTQGWWRLAAPTKLSVAVPMRYLAEDSRAPPTVSPSRRHNEGANDG